MGQTPGPVYGTGRSRLCNSRGPVNGTERTRLWDRAGHVNGTRGRSRLRDGTVRMSVRIWMGREAPSVGGDRMTVYIWLSTGELGYALFVKHR